MQPDVDGVWYNPMYIGVQKSLILKAFRCPTATKWFKLFNTWRYHTYNHKKQAFKSYKQLIRLPIYEADHLHQVKAAIQKVLYKQVFKLLSWLQIPLMTYLCDMSICTFTDIQDKIGAHLFSNEFDTHQTLTQS